LKAKRAALSDANFEKLMLMKRNHHHVETMELGEGAGEQAIMTGLVMLIAQRKAEPIKSNIF